ncbi:hypothetical protein [Actinomadura chibensis]|uniref:Uncharacterized protein n=1 Tax=Actinomadura chibensis TaxID=392828 RepID=A0A5D0NHY5_9ACTN|nr:hypothetical protein [Actinomadura chibensis]TYB43964.1 hypothetical protein FXF69_23660 [Actinomadura chibensis]
MSRAKAAAVNVTVEWAVWGKEPGGEKYKILRCSDGRLDVQDFEAIVTGYAMAARPDSPREVAISRFRDGSDTYLGLAVQSPGEVDWTGRPSAETRFYAIPFEPLTRVPVSYEGICGYFAEYEHPPSDEVINAKLPALDPAFLAEHVDDHTLRTCALVLTNKPVCVVGAAHVPMLARLRYLDAVAALLPYGMRRNFAAATWTSSTADHKFRLYFAGSAPPEVFSVVWEQPTEFPTDPVAYRAGHYFELLSAHRGHLTDLIRQLSLDTREMRFRDLDLQRFAALLNTRPTPRSPKGGEPTRVLEADRPEGTAAELLVELGDALGRQDGGRVDDLVRLLQDLDPPAEERPAIQAVVRDKRLLTADRVTRENQYKVFDVVLRCAFGPSVEPTQLPRIKELAGGLHPALREILRFRSRAFLLAISAEQRPDIFHRTVANFATPELVGLAAQGVLPANVVVIVCAFLCDHRRGPELAACLRSKHFLIPVLARALNDQQEQYDVLSRLFMAAYGGDPTPEALTEIVKHWSRHIPLWGVLQAAAARLYGRPGTFDVLSELLVSDPIEETKLKRKAKGELAALREPAPPMPVPSTAVEPVRKPPGGRHRRKGWRRLVRRILGRLPADDASAPAETKEMPSPQDKPWEQPKSWGSPDRPSQLEERASAILTLLAVFILGLAGLWALMWLFGIR